MSGNVEQWIITSGQNFYDRAGAGYFWTKANSEGNWKLKIYLLLFLLDHILKVNQYLRCHEAW